jgi:N-acetylneuraminic acid mutarotase
VVLGMAGPAAAGAGLRPSGTSAAAGRTAAAGGSGHTSAIPKTARFAPLCGVVKKKGVARCFAERRTDDTAPHMGIQRLAGTIYGYGPADLVSAYNLPANGGAGQTVAIVDAYDDPNAEADLAVYRAQFGLPACTTANGCFRKAAQDGSTNFPAADSGWAGEISLDLDMVSAVAPQAHILLVEASGANSDDLGASVDEAVSLGAKYVSNSYGLSEDPSETTWDQYYNHPGIVITASSGDSGYGPQFPAASPYVTSVGGTSLTKASNTRGWSESAWGGAGSGCSAYEHKPAWQQDSGCSNRTIADVSAVADPATGVAIYDSYQGNGWSSVGGTSVASPIIASVYADAGAPVAGSNPASYPYAGASQLNDVTTGSNGTCTPSYLCTGGSGYDGPTGLGTPSGVAAFTTGPHGIVTGTVTDSSTKAPIVGATVTVGGMTAITDASGHYSSDVPVGTYGATASDFGYASKTVSGVTVPDGGSVTEDIALDPVPSSTVSGTVTDGSGHPWPLYATITIEGVPGGPVRTDPYTGRYSVKLPQGASYTLHVDANYPGYQTQTKNVTVGGSDTTADISLPIDLYSCTAPGYTVHNTGTTQTFDGTSAPTSWTVQQNTAAGGWAFDDPTLYVGGIGALATNRTGGSGNFAVTDTTKVSFSHPADMSLISPVADLSGAANPVVSFDTGLWMNSFGPSTADVDVTTDGGATWKNVWERTSDLPGPAHVDLPLPMAAHQSAVQVRFHFTNGLDAAWQLDNVFLGGRTCDPAPGGLVAGTVTDANIGKGVVGATVTSVDNPTEQVATTASPGDPNVPDGFYWTFSPAGAHDFTAARRNYATTTADVEVAANAVTGTPIALKAGRITVTQTGVNLTAPWHGTASQAVTVKNTGTAPTTVTLGQHAGGIASMTPNGAPTTLIKGHFSPRFTAPAKNGPIRKAAGAAPNSPVSAGEAWTAIADYGPGWVADNRAVSLGGKIYSAFGQSGNEFYHGMYVYDPTAGSWSRSVDPADVRLAPAMVVLNGKIYATGGWDSSGTPDAKTEVFDSAANAWTTAAVNPDPLAGSGAAVVGGKMYVVGGCNQTCGATDVMVYDPATDSWSRGADYPEPVAWESCGAISGELYCAGGEDDGAYGAFNSTRHTYVYDPHSHTWSQAADLPIDLWGAGYTTSGGRLLVSGGVTQNSGAVTNQGFSYDPAGDAWTPIPNSNNAGYRGASACGFYKIGGFQPGTGTMATAEVLPGMADCDDTGQVSWLSSNPTTLTLAPGASAAVTVTGNANVPDITQPGTYTAALVIAPNTPYPVPNIPVSMTVDPPKTWGKITGTVTGPSGPLPGAQIQISTTAGHWTLKTDASGHYQLWLDARYPLQMICSDDGYQPQATTLDIRRGAATTLNFTLQMA